MTWFSRIKSVAGNRFLQLGSETLRCPFLARMPQVLRSIEDVRDRKLEATRTVVKRRFSFRIAAGVPDRRHVGAMIPAGKIETGERTAFEASKSD
jgi:hypothetical protein